MTEKYDGLEWDIDEFPIGSSTPDDLFENSYRAKARCPNCGNSMHDTANFWSRDEDMSAPWLESVDYSPCENCEEEDEELDFGEDEF